MTDVLDTLRSYPDDASIMMSKRVVADVVDEIARLRAELAAERDLRRLANRKFDKAEAERAELARGRAQHRSVHEMLCKEVDELEAERDELRAELAKRDEVMKEAQEKLQPISALVDMTPSGFPDHDICPIRLGMARDLRELRSRIDAALGGGDED